METAFSRSGLTQLQLPLINVAGLWRSDPTEIERVASQIGKAAQDFGFFRIQFHGIDPMLIEATYQMAERFFALTDSQKRRYYIGHSPNHRGYVPFTERGDYFDEIHRNYEAFDLGLDLPKDDPDFLAGNPVLGPNVWPQLSGFKETITRYYSAVSSLGRALCSALEVYLGLAPGAITNHMSKPVSQLRLLHYLRNAENTDHSSVNMGAHTDYECLTILHTRNAGLQVMTSEDRWIDVPVDQSAFVVNIGDMLEAWSNGILRSTPHRVINRSPERFSMPYFVAANYDTEIHPFQHLIEKGKQARYEPFKAGAHLERMLLRDFPYLRLRQRQTDAESPYACAGHVQNPFETRLQGSAA